MPILELRNVYKSYGRVEAVKDLSFSLEEGGLLVILGPSGAGKTSTLKMISGLEPVTKGEIFINGKLINNLEPKDRNVAMVFEEYALYPHLSVFENLASPLRVKGLSEQEIKEKVYGMAEMLQIKELLDRKPAHISGGQKQRVSLGRALIKNAVLYLMDEPIAHLDAKLRHQMRAEFKRIQHDTGIPMVYTTHDFREALSLGTRVIVLSKGVVLQYAEPEEIFERPSNTLVASLVGEPPMNIIKGEVKVIDGKAGFYVNGGFTFPVESKLLDRIVKRLPSSELMVGIRPFDIWIGKKEGMFSIDGVEVYVTELLGNVNIVSIHLGENLIKVRVGKDVKFDIGEKVTISYNPEKLLFFNPLDGNRIDVEGDDNG